MNERSLSILLAGWAVARAPALEANDDTADDEVVDPRNGPNVEHLERRCRGA